MFFFIQGSNRKIFLRASPYLPTNFSIISSNTYSLVIDKIVKLLAIGGRYIPVFDK